LVRDFSTCAIGFAKGVVKRSKGSKKDKKGKERQKELFAFFALLAFFAPSAPTAPGHLHRSYLRPGFSRTLTTPG
jgi:hypothetical protein